MSLLLLFTLLCGGTAVIGMGASSSEKDKLQVAIVDHEDSVWSRILIQTVGDTEYVRTLLDVETMQEEAAKQALLKGDCAAALFLPPNFVNDMAHGNEAVGKVYISPLLSSQGDIIDATLRAGERILVAGQYGVFAGERLLRLHGADPAARNAFLTQSNTELLGAALRGSSTYFTSEVLQYGSARISTTAYFILGALISLLFLVTIPFTPLLLRDYKREMLCRLAACKIGTARFFAGKILLLTLFRYILCLIALFLLRPLGVTPDFLAPLALSLFITLVGACLTVCTGDGITATTLLTLIGMLLCGGLIPLHLLPHSAQLLGRLTPFGAAEALIAPVFGGRFDGIGIGMAFLYTILSLYWMHRKTQRTIAGRDF